VIRLALSSDVPSSLGSFEIVQRYNTYLVNVMGYATGFLLKALHRFIIDLFNYAMLSSLSLGFESLMQLVAYFGRTVLQ
jgi:hypothetical protein